jgi:hypothetical protein
MPDDRRLDRGGNTCHIETVRLLWWLAPGI